MGLRVTSSERSGSDSGRPQEVHAGRLGPIHDKGQQTPMTPHGRVGVVQDHHFYRLPTANRGRGGEASRSHKAANTAIVVGTVAALAAFRPVYDALHKGDTQTPGVETQQDFNQGYNPQGQGLPEDWNGQVQHDVPSTNLNEPGK